MSGGSKDSGETSIETTQTYTEVAQDSEETPVHVDRPEKGLKHGLIRTLKLVSLPLRGEGSGGFTLLELVTIVAIVGILSSIAIPQYSSQIDKARIFRAIVEIRTLEKEIFAYQAVNNAFPETLADIDRASLLDPWGNPYEYLNIQTTTNLGKVRKLMGIVPLNPDEFDLYSKGKDGESRSAITARESHDDIVRATNGKYVGLANGL